ncbi:hypothetical protein EON65_26470, partial [archaeon]
MKAGEVIKIKISQERDRLSYLPYKLLTLSLTEGGGKSIHPPNQTKATSTDAGIHSTMYDMLYPLVLSMSMKKLWNYPIPDEEGKAATLPTHTSNQSPPSSPVTKKRRTDSP